MDPPPPGQHRPRHRPPLRRPGHRRPRRRPGHPGARGRAWPAQLGAAGPHRWGWLALLLGPHRPWQRPASGLSTWIGGPGRSSRPIPSRHASATPTSGSSAAISIHRWRRCRHRCEHGWSANHKCGQLARGSFRPPAPPREAATPGRRWPRSSPGSPPPPSATATASCGSRLATSTTWWPPAPSTPARSTIGCRWPPNAAGSSRRNRARPTAPYSGPPGRPGPPYVPPGSPILNAPIARHRPCGDGRVDQGEG